MVGGTSSHCAQKLWKAAWKDEDPCLGLDLVFLYMLWGSSYFHPRLSHNKTWIWCCEPSAVGGLCITCSPFGDLGKYANSDHQLWCLTISEWEALPIYIPVWGCILVTLIIYSAIGVRALQSHFQGEEKTNSNTHKPSSTESSLKREHGRHRVRIA